MCHVIFHITKPVMEHDLLFVIEIFLEVHVYYVYVVKISNSMPIKLYIINIFVRNSNDIIDILDSMEVTSKIFISSLTVTIHCTSHFRVGGKHW